MDVYNTFLEREIPVTEMLRQEFVRAVCLGALEMREVAQLLKCCLSFVNKSLNSRRLGVWLVN